MKKVYFIAGLGADRRAFTFLDLSFCEPVFIDWITPLPNETLAAYAQRLFTTSIHNEEAIIVGLSFGGMLATEMAKQYPSTKVIIISSAKTYKEIPGYLRMWKNFPVYNYLPSGKMKSSGRLILKILGAKGAEQRELQHEIIQSSNPDFTKWAMHAIVTWDNVVVPPNVIHIHGNADRLLPYKYVKSHHTIPNGEHVMVMDKAAEVSALLKKLTA
jgi:pimeloyl-ACP methyl ester carboxylesterase